MNDNGLLQEIEDDLARQRAEKFWKEYGNTILTVALGIVLITAGFSGYRTYKTNVAQKTTAAYATLFESYKDKNADLTSALDAYAKDNSALALGTLAQLKEASLYLADGKKDQALAVYDAIAADLKAETKFRQLADLLYVQTDMDTGDVAKLEARLQPLMEGSVWSFSAKEYAGYLAIRQGDKEKATKIFADLKNAPNVPVTIGERARDILTWLKGA